MGAERGVARNRGQREESSGNAGVGGLDRVIGGKERESVLHAANIEAPPARMPPMRPATLLPRRPGLLLCLVTGLFLAPGAAGADGLSLGDPAPDFTLAGSDGKTYTLGQFKGERGLVLAWFPRAFTPG